MLQYPWGYRARRKGRRLSAQIVSDDEFHVQLPVARLRRHVEISQFREDMQAGSTTPKYSALHCLQSLTA
jgi:hypothetical protein